MFRSNNPHINTEILEERVVLETRNGDPANTKVPSSPQLPPSGPDAPRETEGPDAAPQPGPAPENHDPLPAHAAPVASSSPTVMRSIRRGIRRLPLLRMFGGWIWGLLHLRRISETAFNATAAAAHAAALAQQAKDQARDQATDARDEARDRLHALEQKTNEYLKSLELAHQRQFKSLERRFIQYEASAGELMVALGATRRDLIRLQENRAYQDVIEQIEALRREILMLQQPAPPIDAIPGSLRFRPEAVSPHSLRLDSLRLALEDAFGEQRESIKQRLRPYLERLQTAGAGQTASPILDLGCGRGEWIELLTENGLSAYGVDPNGAMVERATSLGLDARRVGLLEHLSSLAPSSRSAISAFRPIEPLTLDAIIDYLDEVIRVLTPGGLLILASPGRPGLSASREGLPGADLVQAETLRFIVARCFGNAEIVQCAPGIPDVSSPSQDIAYPLLRPQLPLDNAIIAQRS